MDRLLGASDDRLATALRGGVEHASGDELPTVVTEAGVPALRRRSGVVDGGGKGAAERKPPPY
jgi:ATP-dependent 26S proteasome regulatory subunit